ncbi:EthD domain-containing protein [Pedobacter hartonius]|nr:EthD domain-containing protein [Pedobacter hartonius]
MSFQDFVNYHKNKHAPLFTSIPEAEQYVRKYIVTHVIEAEGFPKPAYDAITEIWFESFKDFHKFFATETISKKCILMKAILLT